MKNSYIYAVLVGPRGIALPRIICKINNQNDSNNITGNFRFSLLRVVRFEFQDIMLVSPSIMYSSFEIFNFCRIRQNVIRATKYPFQTSLISACSQSLARIS